MNGPFIGYFLLLKLKLAHFPRSLTATRAALPSMSRIPSLHSAFLGISRCAQIDLFFASSWQEHQMSSRDRIWLSLCFFSAAQARGARRFLICF
jgi:hypothetical protein